MSSTDRTRGNALFFFFFLRAGEDEGEDMASIARSRAATSKDDIIETPKAKLKI